jgi:hypothetical protein
MKYALLIENSEKIDPETRDLKLLSGMRDFG